MLFNPHMATSKELRLANLRLLVKEFKTADAVAQRAETAPMYLSQILNGVPSSTGKPRGVGDALARRLERGCEKEVGWLDKNHDVVTGVPVATANRMMVEDAEEMRLLTAFRLADDRVRDQLNSAVDAVLIKLEQARRYK